MTFLITVAFIHSGSYLLALSIVVMPARVACASVYEATKTTDITDRDARDSFDDENDFVITVMYMHLKEEEVFEEECGRVCAQLSCHTTAVPIPWLHNKRQYMLSLLRVRSPYYRGTTSGSPSLATLGD